MRYVVLGSLLFVACEPQPPESGPDVIVLVPPLPMPEPEALPPAVDAGGSPKIIGSFHGVPIPEQGPWTKTLPRADGHFDPSDVNKSSSRLSPSTLSYETGPATLHGTYALTVSDHLAAGPMVRIEIQVRSGRVRVFLKYLGDIYRTLDVAPGELEVLEGSAIPGRGTSLTVVFEALDGSAELESLRITSLQQAGSSRRESQPP